MIIKLAKIINVSSEHPSYPASNLLEYPPKSSWRCAKPGELIATVIIQLAECSNIIGLEIGNYHSCIVVIEASSSTEPDHWVPIVNHQFMTHDEAINNKFRDQVQIFTKKELNPENIKIKFDRVKVTCMQSANPRELFGLEFITLRTEVAVDLNLDAFGRFKMKETVDEDKDDFKEKYMKLFGNKKKNSTEQKKNVLVDRSSDQLNKQNDTRESNDSSALDKWKKDKISQLPTSSAPSNNQVSQKPVMRTLFGDVIPNPKPKRTLSPINDPSLDSKTKKPAHAVCDCKSEDKLCAKCNLLQPPKLSINKATAVVEKKGQKKISKPFDKLFEGITFALSGYVNPQRDEIRSKALKMGAKYVANPDTTTNKCTHLICAFKNTPKSQQLRGYCKIVTHKFIEDSFDKKKRIPWRRYAIDRKEKDEPESEEEIDGITSQPSSIAASNSYDQDTDTD